MNTKQFGEKVCALRKKQGMTQAQLAEKLNVSSKTISRWETGEGYPEITLLSPLAHHLDVTVDQLLASEPQSDGENEAETEAETESDVDAEARSRSESESVSKSEKEKRFYKKEEQKTLRHQERPVCWPTFVWKDFVRSVNLSNALHLAYFLVLTMVLYHSNERYLYKNFSDAAAYGYFCSRDKVLLPMGFLAAATIFMFLWNLKKYYRESGENRRHTSFLRNTGLIAVFVLSMLFSLHPVKGSPVDTTHTFYDVEKAGIFDFIMLRMDRRIILICGAAVILIYLIFILTEKKRQRKNSEAPAEYKRKQKWKNFWKSLTVFNKISMATILISMAAAVSYLLFCFSVNLHNMYPDGPFYFFTSVFMIVTYITAVAGVLGPKAGCAAAVIGMAAGLLDVYDRQYKAALILAVVNLAISYLLPVLFMITQMNTQTFEIL